ncbi:MULTISPECIES: hypothetical protein [unclassified Pseudoalteromonas]|uniref:hypothetical protein n=1 Tax=Pseudoalteromonas sp. RB2-MNA-CIBAN-0110 TaxID=3140439 RepID=UPI000466736A|nr:hypothetical protein [Pseudoalteromonas sp. TB13]
MSELMDAVMKWPIIVQGALGSGLFWIILLLGQKIVDKASDAYSHKSKKARISWLISSQFKFALGTPIREHDVKAHFFLFLFIEV